MYKDHPTAQANRPSRRIQAVCGLVLASLTALGCARADSSRITVRGELTDGDDVSGIGLWRGELVIAADEGAALQRLIPDSGGGYSVGSPIGLLPGNVEIDLEGVAVDGETIFAIGSHALKRRRLKPKHSVSRNRRRLHEVVHEKERDGLFRLIPDAGNPERFAIERIDLRPLIEANELLAPFAAIPGKENGIDIEGLATDGRRVWLGFRSPVLREGQVPVMVLDFASPAEYELRFVDLGGRGIRGMTRLKTGFLLIAGPERASQGEFELLLWDGSDMLPGTDAVPGILRSVGKLPNPDGGKPEGLTLIEQGGGAFEVLVVYDGAPGGGIRRMRFDRPD